MAMEKKHANHTPNGETNHATTFATATPFESATKIVLFSVRIHWSMSTGFDEYRISNCQDFIHQTV
jgi:hypothetical protein